ncbi:60S acidic ribosomal protein P2 [Friedmanniomyces endolithicus]|uniref:60S acidic ribosomal protein P2 n=2 Tax=Dothideomycetidae TaxID=451867 RepID=A0A4U0V9M4_9PEZI|nr:60S acidic ribosomal protein P2 [Friedmanniomyces endolithicus]KAK5144180.1 60S acidic ribosomal protein P2 [Rachicladosporium monterosium]KAK0278109.1 60S acidic ribosomal protein P2 [Friedmanniomyces endolithicus]KAK0290773.1 60S acidic ribosomal protein P2 [Friedmanniomyces endolithicus]KAK0314188.1 60S acidic ribosomal protein P2 [Friedmanniomyces endolithicus]
MKHLAAYLLLGLAGNTSPSAEDIKEVLSSVGIEAEEERLTLLLKELKGKDMNELISQGTEKLASVPSGGVGGGSAAPASSAPAAGGAAPAAEAEAAPAEKEAEKEESDEDMGFGLFD